MLHPTSLPGDLDSGDIGHQAYRFIEFLHKHGFKVWQMLPLGPTHEDHSPYQCLSVHAGNPNLISLDWLVDRGWLKKDEIERQGTDELFRKDCLAYSFGVFYQNADQDWIEKLEIFKQQQQFWLDDYALFIALKKSNDNLPWYEWNDALKTRQVSAIENAEQVLRKIIDRVVFEQFVFFTQWHEIREYAKTHEIELFGDMPIFVARDSADVWANKDNFLINDLGEMQFVAGVPPDAFSETGQRWGNPLYDWEYMQADNFDWWKQRFKSQLELFDIIRVDHFRGLQACWHIPDHDPTAINGAWIEVPGEELLNELFDSCEALPLVAEDLGVITDEVIALKDAFSLPGMKVLQFAFDGNNQNPHLPHCHLPGDVIYTGTHDNNTSAGWVTDENNYNREYFQEYLNQKFLSPEQGTMALIRQAMASVSFLSVVPMQDLLLLDESARMNVPGTVENNWQWRFEWDQLSEQVMTDIAHYMKVYQR